MGPIRLACCIQQSLCDSRMRFPSPWKEFSVGRYLANSVNIEGSVGGFTLLVVVGGLLAIGISLLPGNLDANRPKWYVSVRREGSA